MKSINEGSQLAQKEQLDEEDKHIVDTKGLTPMGWQDSEKQGDTQKRAAQSDDGDALINEIAAEEAKKQDS